MKGKNIFNSLEIRLSIFFVLTMFFFALLSVVFLSQFSYDRIVSMALICVIFSLFLGVMVTRSIIKPLKKLADAAHTIGKGNFRYQVELKGWNEVIELSLSFNEMAQRLYNYRRKIHTYFYKVMQSFVRIMEAKDEYIRGHSERVSDYAVKIATRMGFSKDKIELLREEALLHDVGKLGIGESILNKKGKLTKEEWEIVRRHPIMGEEILRPIALNEELLAVIREHHERYDGKGYPDHLKGDEVHIFASIISVADAYDAMTSQRAYRMALSKAAAIEELKKNKTTQFNSKVVDVILQILEQGEIK